MILRHFKQIIRSIALTLLSMVFYTPAVAAVDLLSASSTWAEVLVGNQFDPGQDTQAVAAVDLTGFGGTPLFYMKYDDGGTVGDTSDDEVAFRFRADHAVNNKDEFDGYIWIGLDIDGDNDIDAFMMLIGKNGVYSLNVYDAGTGSNTSPSTTDIDAASIDPVVTGFSFNHSIITDIDATGNPDLDGDTEPDYLISYKVNFDALATALNSKTLTGSLPVANISTINSNAGLTVDTAFQLVVASAQNANTLNGDIGGYDDKNDDLSFTYSSQGAFSGGLSFSNPDPDSVKPVITRLGSDPVSVTVGGSYTDAGATALDDVDGNITGSIVTTGTVDVNTVGTYTIQYNVSDAAGNAADEVTRTVNVVAAVDSVKPVITRLGSDPVSVTVGGSYTDAGATALDDVDGNITGSIVTTGTVDVNTVGTYTIRYNVSDSAGNAADEVTRTVNVVAAVDSVKPVITRLSSDPVTVIEGGSYTDAGATALDDVDGNITGSIVTTGVVDVNTVGTYTIRYNVSDSAGNAADEVTRTVDVVAAVDSVKPVITRLGSDPVSVTVGGSYTDAGATALDDVDGNITGSIVTTGAVDVNTVGAYTIRYNVSDSAGNAADEVTRTVNVLSAFVASEDDDGDGINNGDEGLGDTDGDGTPDYLDLDSDNDGVLDSVEGNIDTDNDGIADYLDLDTDNDGIPDIIEAGGVDVNGDGLVDNFVDTNSDGLDDGVASSPLPDTDTDSDGIPDRQELDSDNDGIKDIVEAGGVDVDNDGLVDGFIDNDSDGFDDNIKITPLALPDTDGDGAKDYVDLDSDNDGVSDLLEGNSDTDGDGVPDYHDLDADNDGIPDIKEAGGTDTNGDGKIDNFTDSDADGLDDSIAGLPLADTDSDADGIPDRKEVDSDNDGIKDIVEAGGIDTNNDGLVDGFTDVDGDGFDDITAASPLLIPDTDGDGIPDFQDKDDQDNDLILDNIDLDADNDGIPDAVEGTNDTDSDGIPNFLDLDSDNDGIKDLVEAGGLDTDNDGMVDGFTDVNNDGLDDSIANNPLPDTDTDMDGIPNRLQLDSDLDGIPDSIEGTTDSDGDGVPNYIDLDSDNDGVLDAVEGNTDIDNDGISDYLDLDTDNDGIPDVAEAGGIDTDADAVIDNFIDTNGDGVNDATAATPLADTDSDSDGAPDRQEIDSDGDGIKDIVEAGGVDANDDGILDVIVDVNGDGYDDNTAISPLILIDTDGNGTPDFQQINGQVKTGLKGVGGGCVIGDGTSTDPTLPVILLISIFYVLRRMNKNNDREK